VVNIDRGLNNIIIVLEIYFFCGLMTVALHFIGIFTKLYCENQDSFSEEDEQNQNLVTELEIQNNRVLLKL
jgi:hypothetical protein